MLFNMGSEPQQGTGVPHIHTFAVGEEMVKSGFVLFVPGTNRKAVLHCSDI
jgi:hypothetical protein